MSLSDLKNSVKGRIVIAERGDCTFIEKARKAQAEGAVAMIIIDNVADTSAENQPMFAMSGDGTDDVLIPVVFLFSTDGDTLKKAIADNPELEVRNRCINTLKRGNWIFGKCCVKKQEKPSL